MKNITLKLATEKDIPTLLNLEKSMMNLKTYSAVTDEGEIREGFKKAIIYLIENNGEAVGSIEYVIKSPNHAYISGFVVDLKFQRQGIGREGLKQLLEKLKIYKRIDLVTHPDNPALNLYKSFGFVVESRKENYWGEGEPRLVLAKSS